VTTFIGFLRGVNVGGHRVVKMERLRALFEELGFGDVRTYIQSGNVFFDTKPTPRVTLERKIAKHLEAKLGFDVTVFVRTVAEVEELVARDPFAGMEPTADSRLFVMFYAEPLPPGLVLPMVSPKGDVELVGHTEREAFLVLHQRPGRPANPGGFLEKISPQPTTGRFFHTTVKILQAAKKAVPERKR